MNQPREDRHLGTLGTTQTQQMAFLQTHWGSQYTFQPPQAPGAKWQATARFGAQDELEEWTAAALLDEVRDHYQGKKHSWPVRQSSERDGQHEEPPNIA